MLVVRVNIVFAESVDACVANAIRRDVEDSGDALVVTGEAVNDTTNRAPRAIELSPRYAVLHGLHFLERNSGGIHEIVVGALAGLRDVWFITGSRRLQRCELLMLDTVCTSSRTIRTVLGGRCIPEASSQFG